MRPTTVAAMRVAAVATLVIIVICVIAAAALDLFLARRVLWEVDQSIVLHVRSVAGSSAPLAAEGTAGDDGSDGAPLYVWWIPGTGRVSELTTGGPRLPTTIAHDADDLPLSHSTGSGTYRYDSVPYRGGYLVGAENLAAPFHIERVVLTAELVIGPVLFVAVFLGVMVISLRSAAPVEAARRRLLELTADASHELRTPLTVIEAELELARAGPVDPVADREALDHIARESRRLISIVEDLLWLARFDAGLPARPDPVPIDLGSVSGACGERFRAVASRRGLSLDVEAQPLRIVADPGWIDRLAGTLIDNACRHATGAVVVRVLGEGGRAVLRVEDDGPGIPDDARLFDRFRRATERQGGAGLGLAIADSVVRSTGGRWKIGRSELGGASMEVSWRAVPSDTPARPPEPVKVP